MNLRETGKTRWVEEVLAKDVVLFNKLNFARFFTKDAPNLRMMRIRVSNLGSDMTQGTKLTGLCYLLMSMSLIMLDTINMIK